MSDEKKSITPGARSLEMVEHDQDLPHILYAVNLKPAQDELLNVDVPHGIALLARWGLDYPTATGELLSRLAKDPESALKLAPIVLGVTNHWLEDEFDEILAAAFPQLTGPWRDAAVDRSGVRELLKLPLGAGYEVVPKPDPSWKWPIGKPFPSGDTVEGVQARLNYFGRGCGPVTGEWNEMTQRALMRWQIENGIEPTGELDEDTIFELEHWAPSAPER